MGYILKKQNKKNIFLQHKEILIIQYSEDERHCELSSINYRDQSHLMKKGKIRNYLFTISGLNTSRKQTWACICDTELSTPQHSEMGHIKNYLPST